MGDSVALPRADPQYISDLQPELTLSKFSRTGINQHASLHGACIEFCYGDAAIERVRELIDQNHSKQIDRSGISKQHKYNQIIQ